MEAAEPLRRRAEEIFQRLVPSSRADRRSQICTELTALGDEPPEIGVWAFGDGGGRVFDAR
jgi:hypothetical protein